MSCTVVCGFKLQLPEYLFRELPPPFSLLSVFPSHQRGQLGYWQDGKKGEGIRCCPEIEARSVPKVLCLRWRMHATSRIAGTFKATGCKTSKGVKSKLRGTCRDFGADQQPPVESRNFDGKFVRINDQSIQPIFELFKMG